MNNFTWVIVFIVYSLIWVAILIYTQHRAQQTIDQLLDRLMAIDFIEFKRETSARASSSEVHNHIKNKLFPLE